MTDHADRAESLLAKTEDAASRLLAGLTSFGLLDSPADEPARLLVREQSRHLFVFVVLSVLLEGRKDQDPADRLVAERIKEDIAHQLVHARGQMRTLADTELAKSDAKIWAARLKKAGLQDPFAPYYGSFDKSRRDPDQGPFGILAERLSRAHFPDGARRVAFDRIFTLAALISDELVEKMTE